MPKSQTGTSTKSFADREITPFRSSGYRELEESRVETLHHRSPEVAKCEMPKSETGTSTKSFTDQEITPFRSSRYRELECRNTSPQECRNAKMPKNKNTFGVGFDYRSWSVETLHHKNREMPKCEIATWSFGDRNMEFWSFGDCDMERQDISSQELSKS
jgi:hypothetical protein